MPSFKQDTVEKEPGLLDQSNAPQGPRRRRLIYIAIAGAVILIALGFGIYVLSSRKTSQPQPSAQTSRLPKLWLIQYFGSEVCSNTKTCGDSADPDNDGLSNFEEFKEGANPVINDTDGDGLADGDEVLIYKTDPVLKFTDRREVASELGYTDGVQVKNGYDPLTPGIKFTDVRKQQINDDTAKYGLHEPTITTLKNLKNSTNTTSVPKKSLTIADLIVSAQTCSPATGNITIRQNTGAGSISIFNEQSQILGLSGQNCHFVSRRTGADLVLDKELSSQSLAAGQTTQAEIDEFEKSLQQQVPELRKNNIGLVQDCNLSSSNLVELLKSWQSGSTSGLSFNMTQDCKLSPPK